MASETPADSKVKDLSRPGRFHAPPGRAAQAARDVDFPVVLRGYDRGAVDRYVEEVNRLIAELEISSSPQSAVRHALEQVSEETSGLLQRAHETADEITTRSRAQADDRLQRAEREAEEVRVVAGREAEQTRAAVVREVEELRAEGQAKLDELSQSAGEIAQERRRLIEDVGRVAKRLAELAEEEAARFPDRPDATQKMEPTEADGDAAPDETPPEPAG